MNIIRNNEDILAGLEALVLLDARLEAVIELAGPLPLRISEPGFAGLAQIVVSQVVSKASADAIWRRMTAATEGSMTAKAYLDIAPETISCLGLSKAKADTLALVARLETEGILDLNGICALDGANALSRLTAIKGIGPWTAEVYLMFCGRHPDVFPSADVALQAAVAHAFRLQGRPTAGTLATMATLWSPWRSVAARLFWAYYASEMRRDVAPLP